MFRLVFSLFLFLITVTSALAGNFSGEEGVVAERYFFGAVLNKNDTADVHERIIVFFQKPKHGLYRYIPIRKLNNIYNVKVYRNGKPENYWLDKEGKVLAIWIGKRNLTLTGRQVYDIYYSVYEPYPSSEIKSREPIRVGFNIVGAGWSFPINQVFFKIVLPTSPLKVEIYEGEQGEEKPFNGQVVVKKNIVEGAKYSPLSPYEGITLYASLPPQSLTVPPLSIFIKLLLRENPFFIYGSLLSIPLFLLWFFGRRYVTVVPKYSPPPISILEAGVLIDDLVDGKDLVALLIDWGNRGVIKIERNEDEILVKKVKDLIPKDKYEKIVFDHLFRNRDQFYLHDLISDRKLRRIIRRIVEEIRDEIEKKYYLFGTLKLKEFSVIFFYVLAFYGVIFGVGFLLIDGLYSVPDVIGIILFLFSFYLASKVIARKKDRAMKLYRELVGFKEFFQRVEKPVIERLLKEDPDYPVKYLPYAVALGICRKWLDYFDPVLYNRLNWLNGVNVYTLVDTGNSAFQKANLSATISAVAGSGSGKGVGGGTVGGGGGGSW